MARPSTQGYKYREGRTNGKQISLVQHTAQYMTAQWRQSPSGRKAKECSVKLVYLVVFNGPLATQIDRARGRTICCKACLQTTIVRYGCRVQQLSESHNSAMTQCHHRNANVAEVYHKPECGPGVECKLRVDNETNQLRSARCC